MSHQVSSLNAGIKGVNSLTGQLVNQQVITQSTANALSTSTSANINQLLPSKYLMGKDFYVVFASSFSFSLFYFPLLSFQNSLLFPCVHEIDPICKVVIKGRRNLIFYDLTLLISVFVFILIYVYVVVALLFYFKVPWSCDMLCFTCSYFVVFCSAKLIMFQWWWLALDKNYIDCLIQSIVLVVFMYWSCLRPTF